MLLPSLSLHFRVHTRVLLTLALAFALTLALWAEPRPQQLIHEAEAAMKADQLPLMLEKAEAAVAARPDYPRFLLVAAIAQAVNQHPDAAFATLNRAADLGVSLNVARQPAFAPLRERPEFAALEKRFAANRAPRGSADAAFTLPDMTGIIEGIAHRAATGEFFFGDVHNRCVWRRDAAGRLSKFSAATDELLGVFGVAIDEHRHALYAATAAVPEMSGYTPADENKTGLARYDLATGKLLGLALVPADGRKHVLGDLAVAPDGSVYATDSFSPIIWRLAPGATALEKYLDDDAAYSSPQGIAFTPDGKFFYFSDYLNGLFRVETATRRAARLLPPAGATFIGLDGLALTPAGLVATQNNGAPARLLRLALDASGEHVTAVKVLVSGVPAMNDLALGCFADGRYFFAGQSGWALFDPPTATPPTRAVTIYSLQP
ncbi:MAG: SMP-30/gluconolactonase/LRE family protein [Opitutae bacterium]|nr:SMP-30/gluconolactonase/LRE family protein [Opitutae bacterium]